MKEFIEKLIDRLEENKKEAQNEGSLSFAMGFKVAKQIVNELAEEYQKTSTIFETVRNDRLDCEVPSDCFEQIKEVRVIDEWTEETKVFKEYSENTPHKSAGGWIPVTERLPKYDVLSEYYEEVIVTLDDGRVTVGCYCNLVKEWWVNAESGTKHAINATGHVIAWQPLPEPYKEEKPAEWKDAVMNHFTKIE